MCRSIGECWRLPRRCLLSTALLFGTIPAVRASRIAPGSALRDPLVERSGGEGAWFACAAGSWRFRSGSHSCCSSRRRLFIRSFDRLANVPLGFDSERVLVADINVSRAAVDADRSSAVFRKPGQMRFARFRA